MENTLEVKIIASLVPLYSDEDEVFIGMIDDLLELDKCLELDIEYVGNVKLSISYIEKYVSLFDRHSPYSSFDALVFSIVIPNEYSKVQAKYIKIGVESELSDTEKMGFFKSTVIEDFKLKIYHLIILSQIGHPGSIRLRAGEVLLNNSIYDKFIPTHHIHRDAYFKTGEIEWPTYKIIPFVQVWAWFQKYEFSYERYSKVKTERALNAFTYLFEDNSEGLVIKLLWALVGIEAIYSSGNEGISNQIFEKTQVLLGPITNFKKKLKQMYDFRSKLVHGSLDIPPNFYDFSNEDDDQFQDKLYESTSLAVAILTVTFQEMVLLDKKELNFKYILD